ncbi:NlpC/P60 family protein [Actinoplanes sp. NPDC051494]|uniref:C40 family peptidase n=1 Tax=Actinoplanes sp. NPDC051494 TaxID=3363907 RepID=UPI0037B83413
MPTLARVIAVAVLSALTLAGLATPAHARDQPTPAELDKRIATGARQLEVLIEQYNGAREELKDTRRRTRALGTRLSPLTRELRRRQVLMDGLMSQTYRRTRTGPAVALFASDRPHDFIDKLLVLHQLAAEKQRAADDLRAARTKVAGTRTLLHALAAQQSRLQLQLRTRQATVKSEINTLKSMRTIAYDGGTRFSPTSNTPAPPYVPGPAGRVVDFAYAQLGKPYRWGAEGPRAYDCSGLTLAAWRTAGAQLPHNAARQYESLPHIDRDQLKPGDLVFFYAPISHVGVYIGDGRMIHAPEYGENVRVATIASQPIHGFARPS